MKNQSPFESRPISTIPLDALEAAIPKIRARLDELRVFDISSVTRFNDPRVEALEMKNRETIASVLGSKTEEFFEYGPKRLNMAPISIAGGTDRSKIQRGLRDGIARQIQRHETLIELFEDRLSEGSGSPLDRARGEISRFLTNQELDLAVSRLYQDGHYADAVEKACKVLETFVRLRGGRDDLSGTTLMQTVFSANKPILAFGDVSTETGHSLQQGMMYLFAGTISAFRNPRAHEVMTDSPNSAARMILFIDYLLSCQRRPGSAGFRL